MSDEKNLTVWDHLDKLRDVIVKSLVVTVAFGILAFFFRDQVFAVILAPRDSNFVTYRWLSALGGIFSQGGPEQFDVRLINTGLAQQFMIHIKVSFAVGVLLASPYILYQLFRYVSPALYADERQYATKVVGGGYLMFMIGVAVSYLLVFPLTFRFLGTYQVNADVENMINLQSYISTLLTMSLAMGIVFEIPVLCWLFAKLGFLTDGFMRRYRRHAVVLILIVAAVITPTSDVFTLSVVALPMYLLYEFSILLVCRSTHCKSGEADADNEDSDLSLL